jgi:hypothetical protein
MTGWRDGHSGDDGPMDGGRKEGKGSIIPTHSIHSFISPIILSWDAYYPPRWPSQLAVQGTMAQIFLIGILSSRHIGKMGEILDFLFEFWVVSFPGIGADSKCRGTNAPGTRAKEKKGTKIEEQKLSNMISEHLGKVTCDKTSMPFTYLLPNIYFFFKLIIQICL